MVHRPEGATIAQFSEATGWQSHTVRGAFAGALKKKLGLEVTSEKAEGGGSTDCRRPVSRDPRKPPPSLAAVARLPGETSRVAGVSSGWGSGRVYF
jgi:hypothetical protein